MNFSCCKLSFDYSNTIIIGETMLFQDEYSGLKQWLKANKFVIVGWRSRSHGISGAGNGLVPGKTPELEIKVTL